MKYSVYAYVLMLASFVGFVACSSGSSGGGEDEDDTPVRAPVVAGVMLDDILNNGNGTDVEVRFGKVEDETLIASYRIFVVKVSSSSSFNLQFAEANLNNSTTVAKNGNDQIVTLGANAVDSDGDPVQENVAYRAYVFSESDGTNATLNSISGPSNTATLAQTTVKITFLQNDGVLVTDMNGGKVIIDALSRNVGTFVSINQNELSRIENGNDPYGNADLLLITHNHGDHYSIASVNAYMSRSGGTKVIAPQSVLNNLGVAGNRQVPLNLNEGERVDTTISGVDIEIIRIRHFNPIDGTNFSAVENLAYILKMGGKNILHIGDGDLTNVNFQSLNLTALGIDVVLLPTFGFSGQLVADKKTVVDTHIDPDIIIGLHLFQNTAESEVTNLYPNAIVFKTPLEFIRF